MTALCAGAFFGAALWFEVLFNHARPASIEIDESNGWLRWWVLHGMIPVPLACAATVLFLVGFRIGAVPFARLPAETRAAAVRWFGGRTALYVGTVLVTAWAAEKYPGDLLARWLPMAVALLLPWRLRRWRSYFKHRQVRRATRAGFRPSWRSTISFRGYVALENLDVALPQGSILPATTNITETQPVKSADLFFRRGDYRSAAYCIARAVEYLLARNQFSDAEAKVRAALDDGRVSGESAFRAAWAEFLAATGQHAEALDILRAERGRRRRPSARLEARTLAIMVDAGRSQAPLDWRWSDWRRARLVWQGQSALVVLGLAVDAWLMASSDAYSATRLAYQICRLPDRLALSAPDHDFDLGGYEQARMAKGLALETAAGVYARRGRHLDASAAFLDAYEEFGLLKDRRRAGRCVVRAFVHALSAGYDSPAQESHALDMIRVGLQVVEDDRGTLRSEETRAAWIASQRELYAAVFLQLAGVKYQQGKAAELGLWLLESLHRSLTAGILIAGGVIEADNGLMAALTELSTAEAGALPNVAADGSPLTAGGVGSDLATLRQRVRSMLGSVREAAVIADAIDTDALLARLGNRTAILYQCWRGDDGWTVHSVLVSAEHGIHVHCGQLSPPPAEAGTPWLTAAGAFDAIADGNSETIASILDGVPVGDADYPLWEEIAQALFPGSWRDLIGPASAGHDPELLVVPDGPIASLPLGALPGRDGRPLLESVPVAMVPSLSMLEPPGSRPGGHGGWPVAVVHRDDRAESELPATAREARHWAAASQSMLVIEADDQAGIEAALRGTPPPDLIVISAHGTDGQPGGASAVRVFSREVRLKDGTVLSEESALRLPWPPSVILASCSVGAATAGAGLEPSGLPLSCLLGGAATVIGGVAPIYDRETADVLCRIIDELPSGASALSLLQRAQAAVWQERRGSEVTAVQVAGLTAWTTAPATVPAAGRPAPSSHWNVDGLPRGEQTDLPDPAAILRPGEAAAEHPRRIAGAGIDERPAPAKRQFWWLPPVAIACLLLVILPDTYSFARFLETQLAGVGGLHGLPRQFERFLGSLLAVVVKILLVLLGGLILGTALVLGTRARRMRGRRHLTEEARLRLQVAEGSAAAATSLGELLLAQDGHADEAEGFLLKAWTQGGKERARELIAERFEKAGRWGELEQAYRASLKKGRRAELIGLGIALWNQEGRQAEAEETFRTAIAEGVDPAVALVNLGRLVGEDGRVDEAVEMLEEAARQGHREAAASTIAKLLADGPRDPEADDWYRIAIAAGDKSAPAYLARRQWARGEHDELERLYRLAIERGHGPAPYAELACLLRMRAPEREAESRELLTEALRREIRWPVLNSVSRQGVIDRDTAIWILTTSVMAISELPRSNACTDREFLDSLLGVAAGRLQEAGREREIPPLYGSVVEHGREEYLSKLAWAHKKHGDVADAKAAFERCVDAGVEPVDALINLGFIAENVGARSEATEYYERAMAAGPPKKAATFLARMLAGGPRDAEVPGLYRLAIRSHDGNAAVLLARRQWTAGETGELTDLYSSAIDWGRDDARLEFACALHVLEPARDAESFEAVRQALEQGIASEDVRATGWRSFIPQSARIWLLEQLTVISATFPPGHASGGARFRALLFVQLGLRHQEAGDAERTRTAMEAAIALGYVPANGYLGELAEADGDTDEAIRRYELASTGGVTWPLINLARLRERMGQPDEMLAVVRRILARVEPDEIGETGEEMHEHGDTSIAVLFLREGMSAGGRRAADALARISARQALPR